MNNAGSTHEGDFHAPQLSTAPRRAKGKRGVSLLFAGLALALGACSTPGPGHAYLHSPALGPTIRDIDPLTGREQAAVPAFLDLGDRVLALAYDHQTDHFFLRLHPGNYVRVVDRPARAIKRDFHILELPRAGTTSPCAHAIETSSLPWEIRPRCFTPISTAIRAASSRLKA